jgi:hypothetical protein
MLRAMAPRMPVGISDFRTVREGGFYYVDKTALVRELVDLGSQVVLFTRPRRGASSRSATTTRLTCSPGST